MKKATQIKLVFGKSSRAGAVEEQASILRYAYAKFSCAIYELAIGPGDVRSRLASAHREFFPVQPSDFPESLRADYQWICRELTKYEPRNQLERKHMGNVGATLSRIKNSTGSRIARRIYELHKKIEDLMGCEGPSVTGAK